MDVRLEAEDRIYHDGEMPPLVGNIPALEMLGTGIVRVHTRGPMQAIAPAGDMVADLTTAVATFVDHPVSVWVDNQGQETRFICAEDMRAATLLPSFVWDPIVERLRDVIIREIFLRSGLTSHFIIDQEPSTAWEYAGSFPDQLDEILRRVTSSLLEPARAEEMVTGYTPDERQVVPLRIQIPTGKRALDLD